MALAERLPNDTSIFLKNTRNWVNKNVLYKAHAMQKWAAVNDGDDGNDNDDEDAVNKIWMMEKFWGVTMQTKSKTSPLSLETGYFNEANQTLTACIIHSIIFTPLCPAVMRTCLHEAANVFIPI